MVVDGERPFQKEADNKGNVGQEMSEFLALFFRQRVSKKKQERQRTSPSASKALLQVQRRNIVMNNDPRPDESVLQNDLVPRPGN